MTEIYSSTALEGPSESGCWRQLDYTMEHGDEGLFKLRYRGDLGVAAHAVMEHAMKRRAESEEDIRETGEEVARVLIEKGRTFRGYQCPPLPANEVYRGVEIAVQYLLAKGLPLDAEETYIEKDFVHPYLPWRSLIDLVTVQTEGDEESEYRVATVTDYKTNWQADESELDTLQRQGQAVVIWRTLADLSKDLHLDAIRLRVVNLRTWNEYESELLWPRHENDIETLARWERRLDHLCETALRMKINGAPRPVQPGAGCLSCPYSHICPDVWDINAIPVGEHTALAVEFAKLEAERKLLIEALKETGKDHVDVPGGWVGYRESQSRVFLPGKQKQIIIDWFAACAADVPYELAPVLESMIAALKLGKSNLDSLAMALYPTRKKGIKEIRDEYVEGLTAEKKGSKFGVWGS